MSRVESSSPFMKSAKRGEHPFGPPMIGALLRVPLEAVQRPMLQRLHEHGFDGFVSRKCLRHVLPFARSGPIRSSMRLKDRVLPLARNRSVLLVLATLAALVLAGAVGSAAQSSSATLPSSSVVWDRFLKVTVG